MSWMIECRGGPYDGLEFWDDELPDELLIVWKCGLRCAGHATSDANHPSIVLRAAEPYRRVAIHKPRRAIYEPASFPTGLHPERLAVKTDPVAA